VSQKLIDTVAAQPKLVPYFDIPLQHASAAVLKRMRRGSHGDAFLKLLERIRAAMPEVALRTSFIVGFPGETEKDFETLCDFVRAARFDHVGVFTYSDEETSQSYPLDGKVSAGEARRRQRHLMAVQRPIAAEKNRRRLGQRLSALLEGPSQETELLWEARLAAQAPEIDSKLYINDCALAEMPAAGSLVTVEITEARDYDLVGRVLDTQVEVAPVPVQGEAPPTLVQIHAAR
jgi:ribosomal protein S12 methylthiotransferase